MLSNRTLQGSHGILRNACISVGGFVYPIDFHIIDMYVDPFHPVILGRPFCVATEINIDNKEDTMTLQYAEEDLKVEFNRLKKLPYEKKTEIKEDRTIEELATIYFNTPQTEWKEA